METDSKRIMVTVEQQNSLLDFMKEHPELAKGQRRGKLMTLKVWNLCAKKLNGVKQGAVKDAKGWSKYWCDWKYRVRRHALELKAAKDNNGPSPEGLTSLSPIEETIMGIIGVNALDGVVIKADPLAGGDLNEDIIRENGEHDNEILNSYATKCIKRKRRRNSSREMSYLDEQDAVSSPPERKARLVGGTESDDDYESTQFLRLEREKLEMSRTLNESVQTLATELTRLTNVISQIKDVIVDKLNT